MDHGAEAPQKSEPSISDLVSQLSAETGTLVRQHLNLATTEMTAKIEAAGRQAMLLIVGAMVASAGGLALVAAMVLGLGTLMAPWAVALVLGSLLLAAAGVLILKAVDGLRKLQLIPRQTLQTLEENETWVKEQLR
jgi:hypothetical protein